MYTLSSVGFFNFFYSLHFGLILLSAFIHTHTPNIFGLPYSIRSITYSKWKQQNIACALCVCLQYAFRIYIKIYRSKCETTFTEPLCFRTLVLELVVAVVTWINFFPRSFICSRAFFPLCCIRFCSVSVRTDTHIFHSRSLGDFQRINSTRWFSTELPFCSGFFRSCWCFVFVYRAKNNHHIDILSVWCKH